MCDSVRANWLPGHELDESCDDAVQLVVPARVWLNVAVHKSLCNQAASKDSSHLRAAAPQLELQKLPCHLQAKPAGRSAWGNALSSALPSCGKHASWACNGLSPLKSQFDIELTFQSTIPSGALRAGADATVACEVEIPERFSR